MSAVIDGRAQELMEAKNFCVVSTIRPDGSILTATVWIDVADGRPILNSAEGRAWPGNLRRDARTTLTVLNMENPYEFVSVRGHAAAFEHEGADEHIDRMAKKYLDLDTYPLRQPGEQRVLIQIEPEWVHLYGAR